MLAYQKLMPPSWMAVPYANREREAMLSAFKVTSVPTAIIFSQDGRLVFENAAAVADLTVANLAYWEATAARLVKAA